MPVLLAAVGDVVFAAAPRPLDRFARQQIEILLEQVRNPLIFQTPLDELVQQVAGGRGTVRKFRARAEGQNSSQPVHAHEAQLDAAQVEHQVRTDTCGLHTEPHMAELFAASAHAGLPDFKSSDSGAGVVGVHQLLGGEDQLVKG